MHYTEKPLFAIVAIGSLGALASLLITVSVQKARQFEEATFTSCHALVQKQAVANFSSIEIEINMDGESEVDTHYWTEVAGPVYSVKTVNGYLDTRNTPVKLGGYGYYVPMEPEPEVNYENERDFDQYSVKVDSKFYGITDKNAKIYFDGSRYLDCMLKLKKD